MKRISLTRWWTGTVATMALLLAGSLEAQAFALRGSVLGNGATPAAGATGSGKALLGTAGQPLVGFSSGASHKVSHGFWSFGGSRVVAVEESPEPSLPERLEFGVPFPNPVRGSARMMLALPKAARVVVNIHDVQGRVVGTLADQEMPAGLHTLRWESRGQAPGVYFAHVSVNGMPFGTHRLVVMR